MSRDLSLLAVVDWQHVSGATKLCDRFGENSWSYVAGPDAHGYVLVADVVGVYCPLKSKRDLRIAPLCWIEDKPVYGGYSLYAKTKDGEYAARVTAVSFDDCILSGVVEEVIAEQHPYMQLGQAVAYDVSQMTFKPPRKEITRTVFISVYETPTGDYTFVTGDFKQDADLMDGMPLIACVETQIKF